MPKRQGSGPKPKPTNLHKLHGTYRKVDHDKRIGEAGYSTDIERPPMSDKAAEHWDKLTADFEAAGIMATVDCDALATYCENWILWRENNARLVKEGAVITSPKDGVTPIINPAFKTSMELVDKLRRFMTEFGMTPCSRVGLKPVKGKEKKKEDPNTLAGFMDKRTG